MVGLHLIPQPVDGDLLVVVGRHDSNIVGGEPGEHGRFGHRVMDLIGAVEGPFEEVIGQPFPPRRGDGDEVGHRAARGQQSLGLFRVADHLTEPTCHIDLQLNQPGRGDPDTGVAVQRVGDEIGDGRVEQTASRNVGQVSRAGAVVGLGHQLVEDQVEKLAIGRALLGQILGMSAGQLRPAFRVRHVLLGQRVDVGGNTRHGPLCRPLVAYRTSATDARISSMHISIRSMWVRKFSTQMRMT